MRVSIVSIQNIDMPEVNYVRFDYVRAAIEISDIDSEATST